MFVGDSMVDAFDNCRTEDILKWSADMGSHCDVIKSMSGRAARETFDMQEPMVLCRTCHVGSCSPAALRALQQTSEKGLIDALKSLHEQGNSAGRTH